MNAGTKVGMGPRIGSTEPLRDMTANSLALIPCNQIGLKNPYSQWYSRGREKIPWLLKKM